MHTNAISRFTPLEFRNGRIARNRVVVPPMASETADPDGYVTETTLAHYRRLARSGAGIVMVEYSYVHRSGRSEERQLGAPSDAYLPGLAALAKAIHDSGALAGLQLTHAGAKSSRGLTDGSLMAPSAVPVPVRDAEMPTPEAMDETAIALWRDSFRAAVGRAARAAFDIVEFHAAHGYGLNQWLSPITNRRDDGYGGSLARNRRLLLEIVGDARTSFPDLLVAVRMPGQDFLEGGLSGADAIEIARALEDAGVDLIDVSSGIGGWRRPRDRAGEGYLVSEAARIQAALAIPVIGVGGIVSGEFIDESLRKGRLSLAAVGRAILQAPEAWHNASLIPSPANSGVLV